MATAVPRAAGRAGTSWNRKVLLGLLSVLSVVAPLGAGVLGAERAAAQTPPSAQVTEGMPSSCGPADGDLNEVADDGFMTLHDYKTMVVKFRGLSTKKIPISAADRPRSVDEAVCVKDVPRCPRSSLVPAGTSLASRHFMSDPSDPLFVHRGLDFHFRSYLFNDGLKTYFHRGQGLLDFGRDFNDAWAARDRSDGKSEYTGYYDGPTDLAREYPDVCVDAAADSSLIRDAYNECATVRPPAPVLPSTTLPGATDEVGFEFVLDPSGTPKDACAKFAAARCEDGTREVRVRLEFTTTSATPVTVEGTRTRCRAFVRRTWECPPTHPVPMNRFNRCAARPDPSAVPAGGSPPCVEAAAAPAAFKGHFAAAGSFDREACEGYVRADYAARPVACNDVRYRFPAFGKDPRWSDVGFTAADYPYASLGMLLPSGLLSAVGGGVDHWCSYDAKWLKRACQENLSGTGCASSTALCLQRGTEIGGCSAIVRTVGCHAVATAIDANRNTTAITARRRALRAALLADWTQEQGCTPCNASPFASAPASPGCARVAAPALTVREQQLKDWLTDYVYGRPAAPVNPDAIDVAELYRQVAHPGMLFETRGRERNSPLGFPRLDAAPCDSSKNGWNFPSDAALGVHSDNERTKLISFGIRLQAALTGTPPPPPSVLLQVLQERRAEQQRILSLYKDGCSPSLGGVEPVGPCRADFSGQVSWDSHTASRVALVNQPLEFRASGIPLAAPIGTEAVSFLRAAQNHPGVSNQTWGDVAGWLGRTAMVPPARRSQDLPDYVEPRMDPTAARPLAGLDPNNTGRNWHATPGSHDPDLVRLANRLDLRVLPDDWLSHDIYEPHQVALVRVSTPQPLSDPTTEQPLVWSTFQVPRGEPAAPAPNQVWSPGGTPGNPSSFRQHDQTCVLAGNPHVELIVTEMWPDQALGGNPAAFKDEFEKLFDDWSDWWPTGSTPADEAQQRRLTAGQGLRYLPDLSGTGLADGDKRHEIVRRNERVECSIDGAQQIRCPWQPARAGFYRVVAVATWDVRHVTRDLAVRGGPVASRQALIWRYFLSKKLKERYDLAEAHPQAFDDRYGNTPKCSLDEAPLTTRRYRVSVFSGGIWQWDTQREPSYEWGIGSADRAWRDHRTGAQTNGNQGGIGDRQLRGREWDLDCLQADIEASGLEPKDYGLKDDLSGLLCADGIGEHVDSSTDLAGGGCMTDEGRPAARCPSLDLRVWCAPPRVGGITPTTWYESFTWQDRGGRLVPRPGGLIDLSRLSAMGTVSVSEPLGLVVYEARGEARSIPLELESNLRFSP